METYTQRVYKSCSRSLEVRGGEAEFGFKPGHFDFEMIPHYMAMILETHVSKYLSELFIYRLELLGKANRKENSFR